MRETSYETWYQLDVGRAWRTHAALRKWLVRRFEAVPDEYVEGDESCGDLGEQSVYAGLGRMPPPRGFEIEAAALELGLHRREGDRRIQFGRLPDRLAGADVRLGHVPKRALRQLNLRYTDLTAGPERYSPTPSSSARR